MKPNRALCLTVIVAVTALTAFSSGVRDKTGDKRTDQAQDQETVRISADLVQLDVIVTDRKSRPVRGLKRGDFESLRQQQASTHKPFFRGGNHRKKGF